MRRERGARRAVVVGVDAITRADVAREGDHGVVSRLGDGPARSAAVIGDLVRDGLVVIRAAARRPCAAVFSDAAADRAVGTDVVVRAAFAVFVHIGARNSAHVASHVVDGDLSNRILSRVAVLLTEVDVR